MQPPHLVAQRSRRRGLPLKADSGTDLPEASSNTKSGAGLRADRVSRATRISAACASEHAARQMISVRTGICHFTFASVCSAVRLVVIECEKEGPVEEDLRLEVEYAGKRAG